MSLTFSDFALADTIQQALTDLEFSAPTPVQAAAIPAALAGKDLLVSSQTGSGKTAAFLLPSLNPLAVNAQAPMSVRAKAIPSPQVLVLCPTRELAQQVSQLDGVEVLFTRPVFHETVLRLSKPVAPVLAAMAKNGVLAGYDLSTDYPELGNALVVCTTETKNAADLNRFVTALVQALASVE